MSIMIQIRHVPEDVHRTLKSRAALSGRSLSDYLRDEISRMAAQPTMEEFRQRLAQRTPVLGLESSADMVRAERDSR